MVWVLRELLICWELLFSFPQSNLTSEPFPEERGSRLCFLSLPFLSFPSNS